MDIPPDVVSLVCHACPTSRDAAGWALSCKTNVKACADVLRARQAKRAAARLSWRRVRASVRMAVMLGRAGVLSSAFGFLFQGWSQIRRLLVDSPYHHEHPAPNLSLAEGKEWKARHLFLQVEDTEVLTEFLRCILRAFPEICAHDEEISRCEAVGEILRTHPPGHTSRGDVFDTLPIFVAIMCQQYSASWYHTV